MTPLRWLTRQVRAARLRLKRRRMRAWRQYLRDAAAEEQARALIAFAVWEYCWSRARPNPHLGNCDVNLDWIPAQGYNDREPGD